MKNISKNVLIMLGVSILGIFALGVFLLINGLNNIASIKQTYKYTIDDVFMSDVSNVIGEVDDRFIKPFISDTVTLKRSFYNKNDSKDKQESSIINYKNTYIQNKGTDYVSEVDFDVVSVYDGEVISIEDSELYGKILTIKHNDNLETIYSNLNNVLVSVGYKVSKGEIIATSTKSSMDDNLSLLHFEVKHKGKYIDPESIYDLNVSFLN